MPILTANALSYEDLVERAFRARLLKYNRINGETVTLQIGRVVYTTSREKAAGLLRGALASTPEGQAPDAVATDRS